MAGGTAEGATSNFIFMRVCGLPGGSASRAATESPSRAATGSPYHAATGGGLSPPRLPDVRYCDNENTSTSEKRIDRSISRNNSVLTPSDLKRILSTEKRAMRKIKQIARRVPEKRQTRKDASLLNKSRQVVTVKNAEPLSMISQK